MANPVKEFHQYLTAATTAHVSHSDYLVAPATAFLKYSVEAKSAIDLCAATGRASFRSSTIRRKFAR